jgi:Tol biopolymer transport system component
MIKTIIKLALAALIANAGWRVGSAYITFYKFQDAVTETAQFGSQKSEEELRQKVLVLAGDYDVPLAENAVTVRRENEHTYVDGSYERILDLVPGYRHPWVFTFHVDTLSYEGARLPSPSK